MKKNASKIEKFIQDYVTSTVTHFKGKAFAWDVINEAVDGNGVRASPYAKVDDFMCKAFKFAKAADPDAELFYNDFNHASMTGWMSGKSNKVYNLIKDLKQRDCGITGVGFQLHVQVDTTDSVFEGIKENVKRYNDLGITVHFTEMDVKCTPGSKGCQHQWTHQLYEQQANVYGKLLQICLDAPNCKNYETWGETDRYSWLFNGANGLPFDKDLKPKPAFTKMLEVFQTHKNN
jgi:endo-1,4-beta-xylanase